ncbi:hypothetical protein N7532_000456 [Penicillium argentinense]|uniref:Uncharacterized protein n=1 Tax=Penicillium argentinense TaxID=1131581 RepID=A0A9W9KNV8_9EURO|nr:uncharacterized protein N7532_000456 [Penicillium argentinense]KAJ5112411.1 hypothetical protein N7532_000456 [Penicillium argentinense]
MAPDPMLIAPEGPLESLKVELLIYNGWHFKDHWAYCIRATGDVMNGFRFEIERFYNLRNSPDHPTKTVPLQWVDGYYFDEKSMPNNGEYKIDNSTVCHFEASTYKANAPERTLNAVSNAVTPGKKLTQKDCQTWIFVSVNQFLEDSIFNLETITYLRNITQ